MADQRRASQRLKANDRQPMIRIPNGMILARCYAVEWLMLDGRRRPVAEPACAALLRGLRVFVFFVWQINAADDS
jgi:hypothetical protein